MGFKSAVIKSLPTRALLSVQISIDSPSVSCQQIINLITILLLLLPHSNLKKNIFESTSVKALNFTFPVLPALPIIWRYVNEFICFPPNNGDLIKTLRAGKLTPIWNSISLHYIHTFEHIN